VPHQFGDRVAGIQSCLSSRPCGTGLRLGLVNPLFRSKTTPKHSGTLFELSSVNLTDNFNLIRKTEKLYFGNKLWVSENYVIVVSIDLIYSLNSFYNYSIRLSEKRRNFILRIKNFQYGLGFSGEIMIEEPNYLDPELGLGTDYEDEEVVSRFAALQNDDECTDISHEVLLVDIFAQQLWKRPLERYRNGVHIHTLREEFWIEINGWLTSYSNLIGHKNLVIDREPLVR
jgi:hypothetical protein